MKVIILGEDKNKEDLYIRMFKKVKDDKIDLVQKINSLKDIQLLNQVIAIEGSCLALIKEDLEL